MERKCAHSLEYEYSNSNSIQKRKEEEWGIYGKHKKCGKWNDILDLLSISEFDPYVCLFEYIQSRISNNVAVEDC